MNITTVRNAINKRAAYMGISNPVYDDADNEEWRWKLNPISHYVQNGDNLERIAEQYGTTVENLMKHNSSTLNESNKDKLKIGQEIFLPTTSDRANIYIFKGFDPYIVQPLSDEQLMRQRWAETTYLPNQVNAATGAVGPLQIRQIALDEANKYRKANGLTEYTLPEMEDWNKAQEVAQNLNYIWGRQYQLATGQKWTGDFYARKHNIGNNWQTDSRGDKYLNKMYSDKASDFLKLPRVTRSQQGQPQQPQQPASQPTA